MKRDYFIYNGEDVVPEYLPGVPSYGQEGAEGNTGETGPSIHYSSYSIEDNLKKCVELINAGKSLSNNIDEIEEPAYLTNDFIIDSIGTVWKIITENFSGDLSIVQANNLSSGENAFRDFSVTCITSYNKNSEITNVEENPYFSSEYVLEAASSSSPKVYHRGYYEPYTYGNKILFKVELNDGYNEEDFKYKYVLLLPNGEQLSIVSSSAVETMYVDNNLFYTFSLDYDYSSSTYLTSKMLDNTFKTDGGFNVSKCIPAGNYEYKITSDNINANINSVPEYVYDGIHPDLKGMIDYHDIDMFIPELGQYVHRNNEYNKFVAITISRYIADFCTAYVEAMHKETGKIYRLDLDDIFLVSSINEETGETNLDEYIPHKDIIEPTHPHVEWTLHEYDRFLIDSSAMSSASERFRRMDSFMIFSSPQENSASEDQKEQNFYYIDVTGVQKNSSNSYYPESYGAKRPNFAASINDKQRTVRLKFMNAVSLTVVIDYNPFTSSSETGNGGTTTMHPLTMIYIGVPDCDLISFGDNIFKDDGTPVDRGIYYLQRFVPVSSTSNYGRHGENMFKSLGIDEDDDTKIVNVGKAVFNIDLSEFELRPNQMHFIEIGAVPMGSWLIDADFDEGDAPDADEYGKDDIIYWNSFHRQSENYNFNTASNAGQSDVTLYVNVLNEVSQDNNFSISINSETSSLIEGKLDTIYDDPTSKDRKSILEIKS